MNMQEPKKDHLASSHPLKRIISSRQKSMVFLKYTLLFFIVIMGLVGLRFAFRSLQDPFIYRKDFLQEYLLIRAVLDSVNPYLPLPELAMRFMIEVPNWGLQHPMAHPPPVAIISLPLGLLSYEHAAVAWFIFEMICIIISVYLLLNFIGGRPGISITIFITLLLFAWYPLQDELAFGQLMALLLILMISAWGALRSGKHIKGGFFLGCIIAIKLIAWPVVLFHISNC